MKKRLQTGALATVGLGIVGAVLRFWLANTGFDEKGLMISSHPGIWLCYGLTALMAAAVIFTVRPISPKLRYARNFPASPLAAAGCAAGALGLALFGFGALRNGSAALNRVCGIAALLTAAVMVVIAWFRLRGQRPHVALGTVVCLFFTLMLYCRYRQWNREAQLSLYFYAMMATICSMLALYHRTALDGNTGSIRAFLGLSLAALFFCCLAIPGSADAPVHLGFALYFAGELTAIRLPRHSVRPEQEA